MGATRMTTALLGAALLASCSAGAPKRGTTPAPAAPRGGTGAEETPARAAAARGLRGEALAAAIMARWMKENPGVDWEAEERKSRTFIPPADNSHLLAKGTQSAGHPYRRFTKKDLLIWKRETERLVAAGSRIFHSAKELGSTVGVSCDMCHPNAANTHPETYPKFQTQLGRVVLLRHMINWCLEQPLRAKPLSGDDPKMIALEAYITSQRAGVKLEYGKH